MIKCNRLKHMGLTGRQIRYWFTESVSRSPFSVIPWDFFVDMIDLIIFTLVNSVPCAVKGFLLSLLALGMQPFIFAPGPEKFPTKFFNPGGAG